MAMIEINDVFLSPEQLEQHGIRLGEIHRLSTKEKRPKCLKHRLRDQYNEIFEIYKKLNRDIQDHVYLTPACEWLLDNFYIIENQVKTIYQNLTRERYQKLSILENENLKGIPRVYALSLELVSHRDGRVDEDLMISFIKAYQSRKTLSIAELWALPLMISMALIENINHICRQLEEGQKQLRLIKQWEGLEGKVFMDTLKDHLRTVEEIHPLLVENLIRLFRKHEISNEEAMDMLKDRVETLEVDFDQILQQSYSLQAGRKISIGNSIGSLHVIANLDWNEIIEELSSVDQILREDPAGIYSKMDFESRDYYRNAIETIAKDCGVSETYIAKKTVECARRAVEEGKPYRRTHVGFFLVSHGKKLLYQELGKRLGEEIHRPLTMYTLPILLSSGLIGIYMGIYAALQFHGNGYDMANSFMLGILVLLLSLIPLSDIFIHLINWLQSRCTKPRLIPKLDLRNGIGEGNATFVVIPTLLMDKKSIDGIIEQLEVHYLANRYEHFYFGIAGDFKDEEQERTPKDEWIIDYTTARIKELNERYPNRPFFYFHRKRVYSETQERWMGWERKRGAIIELNELLRGNQKTNYTTVIGDLDALPEIKYVITLDGDTILPINEGRKLVGAMSHPLNQPILNKDKGIIQDGYGLIQPRISLNIESVNQSTFSRIFAGQGGIDPYTTAVSDVYQDLFGEGIFTGKGIYHLDSFRECIGYNLPENAILSHDLLEGSYLRTGLASDIQLIDGYPGKYSSYMARLHRWVRGDWQLIPWLSDSILNDRNERIKNPINPLSKWKILDNLRRSLTPIFNVIFTLLAFAILPGNVIFWLTLPLINIFFPVILATLNHLLSRGRMKRERISGDMFFGIKSALVQSLLRYVFLPHNGMVMGDAIIRTLYRLKISRKNLLQWTTAAEAERRCSNDAAGYVKRMRASYLVPVLTIITAYWSSPARIILALVLSIPWIFSPWIAYRISQEKEREEAIREEDRQTLSRLSRKIWAFYEDFAGVEDHYLPPDNYQEHPHRGVAHRTSPTNIGFLFMSILSARDFGYISTFEMFKRVRRTLSTIQKLETWNGHLYNWYDTQTLEVLPPSYVSTVDSGNYIAYLITLKVGLLEYLEKNLIDISLVEGLEQTLLLSRVRDFNILKYLKEFKGKDSIYLNQWIELLERIRDADCEDSYWRGKYCQSIDGYQEEIQEYFPRREIIRDVKLTEEEYTTLEEGLKEMDSCNSPKDLERIYRGLISQISASQVKEELERCLSNIQQIKSQALQIIQDIEDIINQTDFSSLYNPKRQLFSIGYNAQEERLTHSYYDLLASEARVVSYLAVVLGQVPKKHWFKLGRAITKIKGFQSLVSWTGTMFEYLMPPIIMKTYDNTLFSETYQTAVNAQIKYGRERRVPWGTSESGYYAFDLFQNYQYKAFGVPELGLKRGLKSDMVVSPYSSILALPFAPIEAMNNIYTLMGSGLEGQYGFYEAVDYTPKRLPQGRDKMVVKSFMTHHQGMCMMVLNNVIHDGIMINRFHREPVIRAGESLLQEKIPLGIMVSKEYKEDIQPLDRDEIQTQHIELRRVLELGQGNPPKVHILTNGQYRIILTETGIGYSSLGDMQITRWRMDQRNYGNFLFVRNIEGNELWSTTHYPLIKEADGYRVIFSEDKAEFIRNDGNIETHTEVVVSPEHPVEIRHVTLTNHGTEDLELEVTNYAELILAPQSADLAHPAFSNLFIRTEEADDFNGVLASRRPREEGTDTRWSFHSVVVEGDRIGHFQYETARYKFIGRGRGIEDAEKLSQPLENSVGAVLDPIISLRTRLRIPAQSSRTVSFISGVAGDRQEALKLGEKYQDGITIKQAMDLAKTRSQILLKNSHWTIKEIELFQDMVGHILFLSPSRRRYQDILLKNHLGQSRLWAHGISGDLPMVLVGISSIQEMDMVEQCIKAHQYWRNKGLKVDLILLNEDESSYYQPMEELLRDKVYSLGSGHLIGQPGGIFLINGAPLPREEYILLYSTARLILKGEQGSIRRQFLGIEEKELPPRKIFAGEKIQYPTLERERSDLFFYNGYGGFTGDGSEYVIELKGDTQTPAPWINVIANPDFGFQVSENGSGFTWAENSREFKITPWSNDPTSDPVGEAIYIRDDEDGSIWTPTPLPIREPQEYEICHGWGYTTFHHDSHGIQQSLTEFVPLEDTIKIKLLSLKNHSERERHLSLTYYIKPVLGVALEDTMYYIHSEWTGDILQMRNTYQSDYPDSLIGIASSEEVLSYTGDQSTFVGRDRDLSKPEALEREALSNRVGAGLSPCGAIQVSITLAPGEERRINFLLGYENEAGELKKLLDRYRDIPTAEHALFEIQNYWRRLLGKIRVSTPDVSMDYLLNGWLLYQSIACRLWARSAFYQSGGAYGYRDQLQDTMNLLPVFPQAAREQILINSAHQFLEGDVQHWWHPGPGDKGIRTRFSDDLLWLPLGVAEYLEQTQDYSILEEEVPFLEDEPLEEGQDERYGIPRISQEKGSVYEHCIRAIQRALRFGENGLPLMGSGDWNDGMSTVGNKGKGESVWVGWFLYLILNRFIPICEHQGDGSRAEYYKKEAEQLIQNIEKNAWDGNWYRRAYFDDGTPLGSIENDECMIDSLAQSWSVISKGGNPERSRQAMTSAEQYLVKREEGIILLFTPPFDQGDLKPGYIKGYVPGVRENGGQYTHGAAWFINALAMMGEGDRAWECFHLINPINHSRTPIECATYKVEPYVMAADVYAHPPHVGRGGWTWYTGAAGWMYTVGLKYILGLQPKGNRLYVQPCIPKFWKEYRVDYRHGDSLYHIKVFNPEGVNHGVKSIKIDGRSIREDYIPLREDQKEYHVEIIL